MSENNDLSERELEILRLVATGASNKQIAQKLFISSNTVKVHLRNIFGKIGAASRTEAAMYAAQIGLVEGIGSIQEDLTAEPPNEFKNPSQLTSLVQKTLLYPRRLLVWSTFVVLFILSVGGTTFLVLQNRGVKVRAGDPTATIQAGGVSNRWKLHTSMLLGKYSFGVVAYESRIYTIAGENNKGVTGSVERYDPILDVWVTLSHKPTAVAEIAAAVIGGKIYVPGGRLSSGKLTDQLEIYDIQADRWEKGQSLPTPISATALVAYEGRLYIFGGWDGKDYLNRSYIYDPALGEWSEIAPMPTRRGFAGAAAVSDRIYVLGGRNRDGDQDVNEVYYPSGDASNSEWAAASPMPAPRSSMGVASLADMIHVVGGMTNGTANPLSLIYFPSSNSWSILDFSMIQPASSLGLVSLETEIFALGGVSQGVAQDQAASYQALFMIAIPFVK